MTPRADNRRPTHLLGAHDNIGEEPQRGTTVILVATWDDLKVILARLSDDGSGALRAYPDPRVDDGREPPFKIQLAAWADGVATDLHDRFGDNVDLTVGFLHFPDAVGRRRDRTPRTPRTPDTTPLLAPDEVSVSLGKPIEVLSGHDLQTDLLVRNHRTEEIVVGTNGQVTAGIVDPETGDVVGGFAGAQRMRGVPFHIQPGETVSIPMLVGTASGVPALGYVVPPGLWAVEVVLDLRGRGRYKTPLLPVTVVA